MNFLLAVASLVTAIAMQVRRPDSHIRLDAGHVLNRITPWMYGSCIEDVNHEIYGGLYAQMLFGESFEEPPGGPRTTDHGPRNVEQVSGMWDGVHTGSCGARFTWDTTEPFNSAHCQLIEITGGEGTAGVANRGLNRWGIAVRRGAAYAGQIHLRQEGYTGRVTVALQSADGGRTYASRTLGPVGRGWARYDFTLKPSQSDDHARLAVWIDRPGSVWVDEAYLSPTGRALFHGLPVRADIADALRAEGITFLRYGGSMVNAPEYRWKHMLGDRDRRPQYRGWWYPYSTNGFGIEEFVQFCRAAGIEPAFAINIDETEQDAADLVEYLNGPPDSPWGRRRARSGHPQPYGVRYIEIGNEEAIDGNRDWYLRYLDRFQKLEAAMHAKDPGLQLVIAAWWRPEEPLVRRIMQELNGKAALWDVHVGGDDLREGPNVDRLFSRMEQLFQEWAPGTRMKAVVFEENGGRHDLQRALGHARILNATRRHGDFVLVDCPANCLQPWKQNDNSWDQGQVFFTPSQAWGMPPFCAQQMASRNREPLRMESESSSPGEDLDVLATRSEDGRTLVLSVVNAGAAEHTASVEVAGFGPPAAEAEVWMLAGELTDVNTPEAPERVRSQRTVFHGAGGRFQYRFPAYSYTVLRLTRPGD